MLDCAEKQGLTFTVSDQKYKMKLVEKTPDGGQIQVTARILKVDDSKVCLEFVRDEGDLIQFYHLFNTFKKFFGCENEEGKEGEGTKEDLIEVETEVKEEVTV